MERAERFARPGGEGRLLRGLPRGHSGGFGAEGVDAAEDGEDEAAGEGDEGAPGGAGEAGVGGFIHGGLDGHAEGVRGDEGTGETDGGGGEEEEERKGEGPSEEAVDGAGAQFRDWGEVGDDGTADEVGDDGGDDGPDAGTPAVGAAGVSGDAAGISEGAGEDKEGDGCDGAGDDGSPRELGSAGEHGGGDEFVFVDEVAVGGGDRLRRRSAVGKRIDGNHKATPGGIRLKRKRLGHGSIA